MADLERDVGISGTMNENLWHTQGQKGGRRGGGVAFGSVGRCRAQQFDDGIVAQVKLIGQAQIEYAREADGAAQGKRLLARTERTVRGDA